MLIAAITIVSVSLAATLVTANSLRPTTPLYLYRMEQLSSKMNFSPSEKNPPAYIAEKGFTVNYTAGVCSDDNGGGTDSVRTTCGGQVYTCNGEITCQGSCPDTCWPTCWNTCWYTCSNTCEITCSTCDVTCSAGCLTAFTMTC